jgi:hypothetical protein
MGRQSQIVVSAAERVILITTPAQLAKRFRQNADDCDRTAATDISRIARDLLLKTAARYRSLADEIERRPDRTVSRPRLNPAPLRATGRAL